MKLKSIIKILILVGTLAVPGFLFFYLLPHYAKNRYKSLPFFGDKQIATTFHTVRGDKIPDTVYHVVPDFNLKNQNGNTISWTNFNQKVLIVNLFYVDSPIAIANQNLKKIADGYVNNKLIHFISISVNPNDTSDQLKVYEKKLNAQTDKWDFLSGDTTQVYPFVRNGLLLDVINHQNEKDSKIVYGNQILLLDNQHRIRGYYDATNKDALAKLDDEIKVLVVEVLRNLKDGR